MRSHAFGPVPSRRLGRSLGIDLVPYKTCSYNCVYCQLGHTTQKTMERRQWADFGEVTASLKPMLAAEPDYITLSGSGEPTLFRPLDQLILAIKRMTRIPVAVLTNGSLLWREDVRQELRHADLVIPTLAAGDEATFRLIHRPHKGLSFPRMVEGLARFRREFAGRYWIEVFLVAGMNDSPNQIEKISRYTEQIAPDRVQLNTADRPPADEAVKPLTQKALSWAALAFRPPAQVIADYHHTEQYRRKDATEQQVMELLNRRPCSVEDIASGLGQHPISVIKCLERLSHDGTIAACVIGGRHYYHVTH